MSMKAKGRNNTSILTCKSRRINIRLGISQKGHTSYGIAQPELDFEFVGGGEIMGFEIKEPVHIYECPPLV